MAVKHVKITVAYQLYGVFAIFSRSMMNQAPKFDPLAVFSLPKQLNSLAQKHAKSTVAAAFLDSAYFQIVEIIGFQDFGNPKSILQIFTKHEFSFKARKTSKESTLGTFTIRELNNYQNLIQSIWIHLCPTW